MDYFGEDDFSEKMTELVEPWFSENLEDGTITGERGVPLHWCGIPHPAEKAAVMVIHGFCEFFGKYEEMAWYLWQMEYSVYFLEQRGHGFSGRETEDPDAVYVKDFRDYVKDQRTFFDQVVRRKSSSQRYFLLAHSMGGLVGTLMLEAYPNLFEKAVLSSPMLRINYGTMKPVLVKLLALWSEIARWEKKYVPGAHAFDGKADFETSSQRSRSRFERILRQRAGEAHNQTNGATYGWTVASIKAARECEKLEDRIKTPVLLLEAGQDTKVDIGGEEHFLSHTAHTKIVRFPESRHEIFNSTDADRKKFYDAIFEFFGEKADTKEG